MRGRGSAERPRRRGLLAAGILLALVFLGFAVLEGIVLAHAKTDLEGDPEVMVVLGAQVKEDGPAVLLRDRLDTALGYLLEHPELPVVVSGGQGENEPTTEAEAMADYLAERGISRDRIWLEETSRNTSQNLQNTKALLREKGYDLTQVRLVVVSNDFHLARVKLLCRRYGLDASVLSAPSSDLGARVFSFVREAPALVKSFLFD